MTRTPPPYLVAKLPLFIRPKLLLFLSVDIVNSTAFKFSAKHKDDEGDSPFRYWFSPISSFYRGIEREFFQKWDSIKKEDKNNFYSENDRPELWKASGDELIYIKKLSHQNEGLFSICVWMETIKSYRKEIRSKFPILDLKASAWLAGFPVNNSEVILRSSLDLHTTNLDDEEDAHFSNLFLLQKYYSNEEKSTFSGLRDFLGPSIDTGFRLSSLSTSRKFGITVDLAYLLSVTALVIPPENFFLKDLKFRYDGRTFLKGVSNGDPYPFIWLDMEDDDVLHKTEDDMLNSKNIPNSEIRKFCDLFLSRGEKHGLMKPYIVNDDYIFGEIPSIHQQKLERLKDYWESENKKRNIEQEIEEKSEPKKEKTEQNFEPLFDLIREKKLDNENKNDDF